MPNRQYFYTPIATEDHNIGEKDGNGVYIGTSACSPGSEDPEVQGELVSVIAEGMICLRVDSVNNRCVVSMPDHITTLIFPEGIIGIPEAQDWQGVNRFQIETDYTNSAVNAPDNERIIDFTVEED